MTQVVSLFILTTSAFILSSLKYLAHCHIKNVPNKGIIEYSNSRQQQIIYETYNTSNVKHPEKIARFITFPASQQV